MRQKDDKSRFWTQQVDKIFKEVDFKYIIPT